MLRSLLLAATLALPSAAAVAGTITTQAIIDGKLVTLEMKVEDIAPPAMVPVNPLFAEPEYCVLVDSFGNPFEWRQLADWEGRYDGDRCDYFAEGLLTGFVETPPFTMKGSSNVQR